MTLSLAHSRMKTTIDLLTAWGRRKNPSRVQPIDWLQALIGTVWAPGMTTKLWRRRIPNPRGA